MKKKFLQIFFILLFFILFFCGNIVLAINTYSAYCDFSPSDLYFTTSWGNRKVLATSSSIYEVYNNAKLELTTLPKIILESTDGTIQQWVYVEKQGNKTYFDVVFNDLDFSKDYFFKVKSTTPGNTADFKQMTLTDDFIAIPSEKTYVTVKNNIISFSKTYSAPCSFTTSDLYFTTSWGNRKVLATTSLISEVYNNNTKLELTTLPKIILESTDGTIQQWVYVEKQGNKTYFDVVFNDLDFSKDYFFKVKSTTPGNTADFKQMTLLDEFIAIPSEKTYVTVKNNIISFSKTYSAPCSFTTSDLYFTTSWGNRKVLATTSLISEVYNNNTKSELTTLPKIILESTDGTIQQWVYVEKQGNKTYFDVVFNDLDFSKDYFFKVKSTTPGNIADFKQMTLTDDFIAIPSEKTYVTVKNNIISFSKTYSAPCSFTTSDLYFTTSWGNRKVLATTSLISEVYNNTKLELTTLPKIILESTDGTIQQWVYVEKQGNKTYFDVVFNDLDFSKDYFFKVKSTTPGNTADFKQMTLLDEFIPISSENIYVTIKNSVIHFSNTYSANISFDPVDLYFVNDTSYNTYIAGMASIYEKVGNITFQPYMNPTIELIANDNSGYSKNAYVEKVGDKYYFSVMLDTLDLSKTYYFRITDRSNNESGKTITNLWIQSINNNLSTFNASEKDSYITFNQTAILGKYGVSGLKAIGDPRGSDLIYYKLGHGSNVLFAVFEVHGYEDLWARDGEELTIIAEEFVKRLALNYDESIMNKWTIYVFPQCNPDGLKYGYTNNGPGRCTMTGTSGHGIDLNRCWGTSFTPQYSNRNYTGPSAFGAYEATYLKNFMLENKSQNGQTVVIDLHGWLNQLIGDRGICLNYYGPQFMGSYSSSLSRYTSSYGSGYLINWARSNLGNSKYSARSALIELPSAGIKNHTSVVNARFSEKYYNATVNMLKGII